MTGPPLTLRRAGHADSEMLLDWRNEPANREASVSQEPVSPEEHRVWLDAVLADPDRHLLIAEADGEPVGQVRFDRKNQGSAYEISVSLDRRRRGYGLGRRLIATACEWAWYSIDAGRIEAWVRRDNRPSRRAFDEAGFARGQGSRTGFVNLTLARPH